MTDSLTSSSGKGLMYFNGPLMLAAETSSEIILPSKVSLKSTNDGLFKLDDTNISFRSVYHLLDPAVANGFILQLVFKSESSEEKK
jgi:hypothetical protein